MEEIKLNDKTMIPNICYGSNIIRYDRDSKIKIIFKIFKKIYMFKFKELKIV